MTPKQLNEQSMDRLLAAQNPWGRARLNARVNRRRLAWLAVVNATFFLKRALDIVGSFFALLLFAPVFAGIAVLVKLDGGPVFFHQTRVGLNGRTFRMLKFRSRDANAACVNVSAQLAWNTYNHSMYASYTNYTRKRRSLLQVFTAYPTKGYLNLFHPRVAPRLPSCYP